ncbi:rho GTPase-activating protein 20-like [Centruroides vittatus]|uniref:rho GTPase-activating protein 20-like n=1 Tax=Centruroides vittatus TaxID=120091 RepID=UPI00350EA5AA
MMINRGEGLNDLQEIQLLFPCDNLYLEECDPINKKKTLYRTKSVTNFRLQRSFTNKLKFTNSVQPTNQVGKEWLTSSAFRKEPVRNFLRSAEVIFTTGMQRHQRHVFLFNDLLLIAKARSPKTYRLKEKIPLNELWLADCVDDVWESASISNSSFVIGWPTTNQVITFSSVHLKDTWYYTLRELIDTAKDKEIPRVLSIQVSFSRSNTENRQTILKITSRHTARDCIILLLKALDSYEDYHHYRLWTKYGKDGSPYPLIGHEYPFCIKMNMMRKSLQRSEIGQSDSRNKPKCFFILRRTSDDNYKLGDKKKTKKLKKSPFIPWPFRRQISKQNVNQEDKNCVSRGQLFGQSLEKVCQQSLPKPISAILDQLYEKGPHTVDIFRKSATTKACKEMKTALDKNPDYKIEMKPTIVLACVLKDYLRCLPDCLLSSNLYEEWLETVDIQPEWKRKETVTNLLNRLPPQNIQLLKQLLCVLWKISQYSSENKMTSYNLAVCMGPTLLCPTDPGKSFLMSEDVSKKTPSLVCYLIDNWPVLFHEEYNQIMDERQDSGAEESDSFHGGGGGFRRDDSSVDSLERDCLETSAKLSLTNISRDSGLTLSDTQLYNENEECTKSVPHLSSISGTCCQVVRRRKLVRTDKTPTKWCHSMQNPHLASEDSLFQKRPALHRKGRAPSPPMKPLKPSSPHPRRLLYGHRADRHAVWFAAHCRSPGWKRSQSTSHIDLIDSDGDNTPNISRSSSLVRDSSTMKANADMRKQEQLSLSAKAKQLYEESVRLYNEQLADTHRAVLVKVDSEDNLDSSPKVHSEY